MNKNILFTLLLILSSGHGSFFQKVQNKVRAHMFTKKEIISGFCLAPLTFYAGLKTKEHHMKTCKNKLDMKSLKKMIGWAVAGGLCNYAVYQNIEHLFKKIPLQKKKIFTTSVAHSAFLLLYALWSNNRPPPGPTFSGQTEKTENKTKKSYNYNFLAGSIIFMGLFYILELKLMKLAMKNAFLKIKIIQLLLLNGFYFATFPKKNFYSKKELKPSTST